MSRSKQSFSNSWLHVLRMLDKAAWALAQRKVDFSTLIEKNQITDMGPSNLGVEYTEYVFEVFSYLPGFRACYVRIWLREKAVNVRRVEKVLVTSPKAEVLGEWDGTTRKEKSFEVFLANINRASLQYLYALVLGRPTLAPYVERSVQLSWMNQEMVIVQQDNNVIVVRAIDNNLHRCVAELELHVSNEHYSAETIKLFESLSIDVVSSIYHRGENLWSNE